MQIQRKKTLRADTKAAKVIKEYKDKAKSKALTLQERIERLEKLAGIDNA
jgi:hypothetical protein